MEQGYYKKDTDEYENKNSQKIITFVSELAIQLYGETAELTNLQILLSLGITRTMRTIPEEVSSILPKIVEIFILDRNL